MGKNTGESIFKNLSSNYSQKCLDHFKKIATDAFKISSKRAIQKIAEVTCDLIGNKTANRIKKVSKNFQLNNSETVTNEHDKEIPKPRYVSPK